MPCLEISMPTQTAEVRRDLANRLTDIFEKVTPFNREIFGILFHEYQPGSAAIGGEMDVVVGHPYLHLLFYCPRISRSAKQKLVEGWTRSFAKAVGHADWQPVIHICEHPYENVGVEGALLSDAYPECAERPFYNDLPSD